MTTRWALIDWPDGTQATLSAFGWTVDHPDLKLAELLNARYGLIDVQARREELAKVGRSPVVVYPDLLATAARSAASATGAEVVYCDPPDRVRDLEKSRVDR